MNDCKLKDLSGIICFEHLEILEAKNNQISDLIELEMCTSIKKLDLENNLIENQDMKALYIKIPNKFKIRKTPNYQFKKIMPIGHLNSKISSKTSDNLELIPVNKKKNSVK